MPADTNDYRVLQTFLESVGRSSLLDYLGLPEDPDAQQSVAAVRARGQWARARLSNTRTGQEARMVVRHQLRMERVLTAAVAQPEDRSMVHALRTTWTRLARADLAHAERMERLAREAEGLGVTPDHLTRLLVVGTVTHPSRGIPVPSSAPALAKRLNEVLHQAILPLAEVESLLQSAQSRHLTPAETLVELDVAVHAARRAGTRRHGDPTHTLAQRQSALDELGDSVRGLALQGLLTDQSLRGLARHARRQGLPRAQVAALLRHAQATAHQLERDPAIARALLKVPKAAPSDVLDAAWTTARAQVAAIGTRWRRARAAMTLDMAWATLRRAVPTPAAGAEETPTTPGKAKRKPAYSTSTPST